MLSNKGSKIMLFFGRDFVKSLPQNCLRNGRIKITANMSVITTTFRLQNAFWK